MTAEEKFENIVSKLEVIHREGYSVRARCPAHGSKGGTLSVRIGEKLISINCFAGCTGRDIMASIGLGLQDLYFGKGGPDKEYNKRRPPGQADATVISKEETRKALLREIFPEVESYEGWAYNEDRELDERLLSYCENYEEMVRALPKRAIRLEIVWLRLNTLMHALMWHHDMLMGNHQKAEEFMLKCDKAALRQFALVGIIESAIFPKVKYGTLLDDYLKVCSRGIWAWERGLCTE
jgi:hypothetical protein